MDPTTALITLRQEALQCLTENILPFWLRNMQDHRRGGWYGQMTGHGILVPDAPRSAVLYARLLWTFSAAHRVLGPHAAPGCLNAARRTKDYIEAHFLDHRHGGTFWSVNADGTPLDTKKQTYAQGFMSYGFSEFARATAASTDPDLRRQAAEALHTARQLMQCTEQHAWDRRYGGYIEALTRDWQPLSDMRLSPKDQNLPKSQNTHLHILEPYTNLVRALREMGGDSGGESAPGQPTPKLERLLTLFTDRILDPQTHHLTLFFDNDWTRRSTTVSYGHDIEASWLLHDAALVLGDARVLRRIQPLVRHIAAASLQGLQPDGSMIYEGPTDSPPDSTPDSPPALPVLEGSGSSSLERHWWVQAETIVGLLNLHQHFGDRDALHHALRCWHYTRTHLIDHQRGEWFWSIRPDGTVNLDDDHAGFWKCPYHNSRMCLEIIQRTQHITAS